MRWYSARVADNDDATQRLRLRLEIPDLFGEAVHETWVEPLRVPGWWIVPPVDAVVIVAREDGGRLFWCHQATGSRSEAPEELRAGYPRRAGLYSPEEAARVVLDDAGGGVAHLLAGEVRLASKVTSSVEPIILGDTFLADYVVFRNAVKAFMSSASGQVTATPIGSAATVANTAMTAVASKAADVYKARIGRVE